MAYDGAFAPQVGGQCVLVDLQAVQIPAPGSNQTQATSYRIRCLVAGYLAWNPMLANNATPTFTAAAPTIPAPAVNTIGMVVGQTEVLNLPANAWFKSSVAAGFEVYPGEGL